MTRRFHLLPRSIRGRLTTLATLVAAAVFASSSALALAVAPGAIRSMVEEHVELAARQTAGEVRRGTLRPTLSLSQVGRDYVQFLEVRTPEGEVLATVPGAAGALPVDGWVPASLEHVEAHVFHVSPDRLPPTNSADYYAVALKVQGPGGQSVVYAGGSTHDASHLLTVVRLVVFLGTPFLLALIALVTWVMTGLALRPVEGIRAELSEITGEDLGRRVPVPDSGDEIARLALATNDTLSRLERSAETQQRFIADASHELRSPLAGLRAELEVAADDPENTDWPECNARALHSVERLSGTVEELLMLARLDGGAPSPRQVVDVAELAAAELERWKNGQVPVNGLLSGPALVLGSRLQLERLLTNLMDNAERHGEKLVTLRVAVDEYTDEVVVEVTDDGAGVAPEDRDRIFERFTRLTEGRTRDPGGSGLGLPLSREIATAHGGTVVLDSAAAVTRFVVRLPRYDSRP